MAAYAAASRAGFTISAVVAVACALVVASTTTAAPAPPAAGGGAGGLPPWVQRLRALGGGTPPPPTLGSIPEGKKQKHAVVAKDAIPGGGQFRSINDALAAAEDQIGSEEEPYIVFIKQGVYEEYVSITRKHVLLIGEGMGKTVITGNRSVAIDHLTTNTTATVSAHGLGFMAQDLTISNTAGAAGKQAVALMSRSNYSLVYRCSIEGFQDTLDADTGRQMYLDCWIRGTVDFIFGYARASFLGCRILLRNPGAASVHNVVTAQGRSDPHDDSGFAFHNCSVTADDGVDLTGVESFLGRPWKPHSHVIFMESFLGSVINFTGWVEWNRSSHEPIPDTVVYLEYGNTGPGADTSRRVRNKDVRVATCSEAAGYTPGRFINAADWMPKYADGKQIIPYTDGLLHPCLAAASLDEDGPPPQA